MEKIPSKSPVIALIPMGIPAIGKSKIFESLMKNEAALKNFHFDAVSSDDIRKECIDQYMASHPTADSDTAFSKTQGPYKGAFGSALSKLQNFIFL